MVFGEPIRRGWLLKTLVVVGAYLGAMAVLERVGPQVLVFPRYILDPTVGIHVDRARGPFTESVANGVVLSICGFAAAAGAHRLRGLWRRWAVISAALCAVGVVLTLTRSVWIGAALGLVLAFASFRGTRRFLPAVVAGGGLLVLCVLLTVPGLRSSADDRARSQLPVWDRKNTDIAAVRIVEARPLTGVGWLRFIDRGAEYVRQADSYPITAVNLEVHNVILARASELGLPGGVLFVVCLVGGPGRAAVRRQPSDELQGWRWVLIAGGACWFVAAMLSPLAQPMPNFLIWTLSGMLLAGTGRAGQKDPGRAHAPAGAAA